MFGQTYSLKFEVQKIIDLERTNPDCAFSMWRDLLCDYSAYLNDEEYIKILIEEFLSSITDNYYKYFSKFQDGQAMMEHVLPYMIKYPEIIELIYSVAGRAGCLYHSSNHSALCLACFIVSDQAETTYDIIEYMSKNKVIKDVKRQYDILNYVEFSVGKFLVKTYDYVNILINENGKKNYKITDNVKQTLLKSIELFDDKMIRAECTIPIMAMIGYGI